MPDLLTLAGLMAAVLFATTFRGRYIADVLEGRRNLLSPIPGPLERGFYRMAGIDPTREQGWRGYAVSMLTFSFASIVLLRAAAAAGGPAAQSDRRRAGRPRSRPQHGGELHHQYELDRP